ncbi:protein S40-7-like [Lycium ferocissimum]|uniref:protein S40-7-like n=1 Tax=Lycium ferocissimum TaxID=112874 RepID=UPI002815FFA5|nr:protein S40-7-like [Lycium ferocissimum]
MDQNGVVSFRHRQSPSSDRFLTVFSPPQNNTPLNAVDDDDDELNEDEVFWTGRDLTESQLRSSTTFPSQRRQLSFRQHDNFGILAALTEDSRKPDFSVVRRKSSVASSPEQISSSPSTVIPFSRAFPSIPKPPPSGNNNFSHSKSMPARNFQHSAPVNVPMMAKRAPRNSELAEVEIDDDDADDEMLPPHEMVARGSMRSSPRTTFSVLEGVGRTLKGRDLRQVRNAVWRQTGFQD